MENSKKNAEYTSRGGISIICFLIIIIGQPIMLRKVLFNGGLASIPSMYYIELIFCLVMVVGIIFCFVKKDGWGGVKGHIIVFALFILYCIFTALHYTAFAEAYLTGFNAEFKSAGGALVILKLFLALIAVIGGMPAPKVDGREYARALRERVQKQEAQWAQESIKGAKKDLNATVRKLKSSLTDEELKELMAQLNGDSVSPYDDEDTSISEDMHGWGGGI